jgi:hypothetical protein
MFELLHIAQVTNRESIWGPFTDVGDWNFAWWILWSGTTHTSMDKLLDLEKVSQSCCQVHDLLKHHRFVM